MTRQRLSTIALLLGLILAAEATHAATRFMPPLVLDGAHQFDRYLVNVSNQLREATLQVLNRNRITFRFLVDSPLRPPNNALEQGDGSSDDVLCFEGIVQHPSYEHVILGEAIGCAQIMAQHPLVASDVVKEGEVILSLNVRHIIHLIGWMTTLLLWYP
jgi:hypothetical protein